MFTLLIVLSVLSFPDGRIAPVPFTTIAEGQQSGVEDKREVVVRTDEEWKALWKQHAPDKPLPAVDFTKSMVVGVFLGSRNTGGYRATITAVDKESTDVVVTWHESRPSADLIVTQVLTFPYHLVRIDRSPAPVKFRSMPAPPR
jgi:hypothetical protein